MGAFRHEAKVDELVHDRDMAYSDEANRSGTGDGGGMLEAKVREVEKLSRYADGEKVLA